MAILTIHSGTTILQVCLINFKHQKAGQLYKELLQAGTAQTISGIKELHISPVPASGA